MWMAAILILVSSGLHLGWNAFLKGQDGSLATTCWLSTGAAASAWVAVAGLPLIHIPGVPALAAGSWAQVPWALVLMSIGAHALYFGALATAYRHTTMSWVYPLARGLAILLTLAGTLWLFRSAPSPLALVGVVLVVVGVVLINVRHRVSIAAWSATLLVGTMVAAYTVVDSHAVHAFNPPLYLALGFSGEALILWVWGLATRQLEQPFRGTPLVAGLASYTSYLLMLYAFRLEAAAPALALRQVAPALAPVVAAIWLKERPDWRRYVGAGLIALAAVFLMI